MLQELYTHKDKVDEKLFWVIVQIILYIPENKGYTTEAV